MPLPSNEVIQLYRQVFSGRHGQAVLHHMLYDLGVFHEDYIVNDPNATALRNYGVRLLRILGGGDPAPGSIEEFTKRLMRQPLPKEKEE